MRTLATLDRSSFKVELEPERRLLARMTEALLKLAFATNVRLTGSARLTEQAGLPTSYLDQPGHPNHAEPGVSALFASASYRLAQLGYCNSTIADAERVRVLAQAAVDGEGVVHQTIDHPTGAVKFRGRQVSPEAHAFMLLMHAAHRDWLGSGSDE